jgi:hypothetical protein
VTAEPRASSLSDFTDRSEGNLAQPGFSAVDQRQVRQAVSVSFATDIRISSK